MLDTFFKYLAPGPLRKEVKVSTIIHISILMFFIISTFFFGHRFKYNKPSIHSVQLVNLGQLRPQTTATSAAPVTAPVAKPQESIKTPPAEIKTESTPKAKVEAVKPPKIETKSTMTIPTKEQKMQNVKTLEQRLQEKFKQFDTKTPQSREKTDIAKWQEPNTANQSTVSSASTGLSVTASGPDSSNFPFAWYLDNIQNKITSCWTEPQMALAKQYSAVVSFTINNTGEISNIKIKKSSGITEFDQSGLQAIERAKPFPPLPPGYTYPELVVNAEFSLQ